jgi:hypothetical protein
VGHWQTRLQSGGMLRVEDPPNPKGALGDP